MINKEVIFGTIGLLFGLASGSISTYFVVKKKLEAEKEEEINELKKYYDTVARKKKTGPYSKFEDFAKEMNKLRREDYLNYLKQLGYESEEEAQKDPNFTMPKWVEAGDNSEEVKTSKVVKTEWYSKETIEEVDDMRSRTIDDPYVISYEEYADEHSDFDKVTLTYYEGDDTLTDDRDEPIDDVSRQIGEDALTMFGRKSHDKNVVYVRNERLGSDFEVMRDPGKYSVIILNIEEPKPIKVHKMKVQD